VGEDRYEITYGQVIKRPNDSNYFRLSFPKAIVQASQACNSARRSFLWPIVGLESEFILGQIVSVSRF